MKNEHPGKRTDPSKLAKERAAIRKDKDDRGPGLIEVATTELYKKTNRNRQRKSGYGNPPQVPGALQYGHKPEDKTA